MGPGDHPRGVCSSVRGSPPARGEWPPGRLTGRGHAALRERVGGRVRLRSAVAMATAGKPASGPPAAGLPARQPALRDLAMTTDSSGVPKGPKQLAPHFPLIWCLGGN